ncbi:hypothetical protein [Aurantibacter aestuarii]|uniref:Uncharacterized protein n=1 Tax=Aurantibacter aestuarii TaxID=1266046 RepID=A0A2T1N703_9FLAO|nr:hypothetical protein [Aurantibacter aestuarii]PSG87330.1 hypothetical protein C7H52_11010 [Aurantibacter aestuarii]
MIRENENSSAKFSTEKINGVYKNQINNNDKIGLWNILADNKTFKRDTTLVSENSFVKLELISETELKASLIENDSIIKNIEFKGKIVGDYFSINKKFLLIPIPALLFLKERKTIIGNNENGNLILTRGIKNGGWFLLFAADSGGITSYEFEQKKTNHNNVYN